MHEGIRTYIGIPPPRHSSKVSNIQKNGKGDRREPIGFDFN